MIILHSRRVVFVRCRKTAGTSLEIELSRHALAGDVITPISPRDEVIRQAAGGRSPQNYVRPNATDYYNHMTATQIIEVMGRKLWESYFSFCIERNPWDKVVSLFFHRLGRSTNCTTLSDFISTGEFLDARNSNLYLSEGRCLVDYVGKYESLDESLGFVFSTVGLKYSGLVHSAKRHFRPPGDDYRRNYSPKDADAVAEAFAAEIAFHGYRFEG